MSSANTLLYTWFISKYKKDLTNVAFGNSKHEHYNVFGQLSGC